MLSGGEAEDGTDVLRVATLVSSFPPAKNDRWDVVITQLRTYLPPQMKY